MKRILATLFVCVLSACASPPPAPVKQVVDASPAINLDVLTVTVLDRTMPQPGTSPYNTNNFQPTLASAIRQWATQKLVAVGTTGEAIIVIRDATLNAETIPHPDSWFTREQTSKYVGHASIEVGITRRNQQGQVTAEASRFETLPEQPSSLERQNAYNKILNGVMQELTANVRAGVNQHLAGFVLAQTPSP